MGPPTSDLESLMSPGPGHRPTPARRPGPHPLTVLAALCGLFIVYGTTIPFEPVAEPIPLAEGWRRAVDAASQRSSRTDRAANVLLFMPLGAMIAARLGRAGAGPIGSVLVASAVGAALSFGVETLQINLRMRVTSVSDLMNNAIGSALGGVIGWLLARWAWPWLWPTLKRGAATSPLAALAIVSSIGWGVIELAPFVPSADVGDLKQAVKSARLIPFGPSIGGSRPDPDPWAWAVEALSWSLLGGLVALAVRERGERGVELVAETIVLSAAFRAGVELVQLGFPGHVTDATPVVLASAGAAASALAVAAFPRLPARAWIGPGLVVWAASVLIDGAVPFDSFGRPRALDSWMAFPFYSYFWSPPTSALTNAAEKVASMVPLGFLLASRSRGRTPATVALAGWAAGASIEATQLFNAARTPDLTDTFLAAFGAWLGCSALRAWESSRTSPSPSTA